MPEVMFAASPAESPEKPDPMKWVKDFLAGGTAGKYLLTPIYSHLDLIRGVHPRSVYLVWYKTG